MIKRDSVSSSTISNLITSYANLVLQIITGIIVTRSLGVELKGEFANLRLVVILYGPILLFGYNGGVLYYGLKKILQLDRFFWTGSIVVFALSVIGFLILFPLVQHGYLGSIIAGLDEFYILLGLIILPLIFFNGYSEKVLRSFHLFKASNYRIIIANFSTFIFYLICFLFYQIKLKEALIGVLIGQSIQTLMNVYYIIKIVKVSPLNSFKNAFKPFKYGVQNWLNQLLSTSNDKIDQVILTFLLSASSFAIYVVGVGLSNMITAIPLSYANVFLNQIAESSIENGLKLYARAQRVSFIISTILVILLMLFSYPLIYLMYGSEFTEASFVVLIYAPGLIFQTAARFSIKFYAGIGRPLMNSLIYFAGILGSLPFYFWLVPEYGIYGAAISSTIAYFSAFLFSSFQIHKEYNVQIRDILIPQKDDVYFIKEKLTRVPIVGKFLKK